MSWFNPLTWFVKPPETKPAGELPPSQVARSFDISNAPGQGKGGILNFLRRITGGTGWTGPQMIGQPGPGEYVANEKIRSGPSGVNIPAFLPYFGSNYTDENPQMRRAYRQMWKDPLVKAAALGKILDVASLDGHVNHPDKHGQDPEREERNKQVAEFLDWNLNERLKGGLPGLCVTIGMHLLTDGYTVDELVIELEERHLDYHGKAVLDKVKAKDVDNDVVLVEDEFNNAVGMLGIRYNSGGVFSPVGFIVSEYLKMYETPGGMSDFRAAYAAYWQIDTARKLRMIGVNSRAIPMLHGTYRDQGMRAFLENALGLAQSSNWMATPETIKVQMLELAGQSHQIFKETIEDLKQDLAIAITGSHLQMMEGTTQGGAGDTTEHRNTADLQKWYLRALIVEIINKQVIPYLVDLNYVGVDYPLFTMGGINEQQLLVSAQLDKLLMDMGLPLSIKATYKKYGREAPVDPEDALTPKPAQQPGIAGGLPPGPGDEGGPSVPGLGKPVQLEPKEPELPKPERFEEFCERIIKAIEGRKSQPVPTPAEKAATVAAERFAELRASHGGGVAAAVVMATADIVRKFAEAEKFDSSAGNKGATPADADFEKKHPRKGGKFAPKGGGDSGKKEEPKPEEKPKEEPGKPNKKEGVSGESTKLKMATPEARKAAFQKAIQKAKNAPQPSAEDIEKAKVGIAELGANLYRKKFVGNSTDRAARRKKLQEEFGDGTQCPCVWCGTFVGDAVGEGTLEQDKIFTTGEGGRYKTSNLVPSCGACNKRRSDKTFANFSQEFEHA